MKRIIKSIVAFIRDRLLGSHLEFRVRLFNILAMGGIIVSLFVAITGLFVDVGTVNMITTTLCTLSASFLLYYSYRSGKYQLCYMVTIVAIFLVFFPILFFSSGGFLSGTPSFFVFAVLFTIFMLEGKKAFILSAIELFEYITICVIARLYPHTVNWIDSIDKVWLDIMFSFVAVSVISGICLHLHFRLYNQQQKKLDEQNAILSQANRFKTEFLANASHEMRTPLTVTSVNVQTVMEILDDTGASTNDPETMELLKSAQNEIMRLSRMTGGMLTLASMSESMDKCKIDLSPLLQSVTDMMRLHLNKRGIALETEIAPDLSVFGNADLLAQVLTNILQNAGRYTSGGTVTVSAKRCGRAIEVSVRDSGTGISPEILDRVFERGVSTGGTGFGLYLCRTVVESHGGGIWVESEPDKGTTVFYTLPFYEGQFGGA